MTYTQFIQFDKEGNIVESLGSDGIFMLDGRNKLETMIDDSKDRFTRMTKNIHPEYIGFRIMKGPRLDNSRCIHQWIL